jgi:hypothetical protein
MFKGARRIGFLLAGLWAVGWVAYAVFNQPYSRMIYAVQRPGNPPILVDSCGYENASGWLNLETSSGETVRIQLCFMARRGDDGEMYIPYALTGTGKRWIGGTKYADEVLTYMRRVERTFQLTDDIVKHAKASEREARLAQWKESLAFLFGGLVIGWALVAAPDWIVRGFMGIPRGRDARPSE